MTRIIMILLLAGAAAACTAGRADRLRMEIAVIDQRISAVEAEIDAQTASISQTAEGVLSHVSYAPLSRWTSAFNAQPQANRTLRFEQTSSEGSLAEQSHVCKLECPRPWSCTWRKEAGLEARLAENSLRGAVEVQSLTVAPEPDGLSLRAPLDARFRAFVAGSYRPPCTAWVRDRISVSAEARPMTEFRLKLGMNDGDSLGYSLDLVQPQSVNLELATRVGPFTVRFTTPIHNVATQLGSGQISLLLDNEGHLILPDGQMIPYRLRSQNPFVRPIASGIEAGSDVVIEFDREALRAALGAPPISTN